MPITQEPLHESTFAPTVGAFAPKLNPTRTRPSGCQERSTRQSQINLLMQTNFQLSASVRDLTQQIATLRAELSQAQNFAYNLMTQAVAAHQRATDAESTIAIEAANSKAVATAARTSPTLIASPTTPILGANSGAPAGPPTSPLLLSIQHPNPHYVEPSNSDRETTAPPPIIPVQGQDMSITLPTTPPRKYKGGLVPDSLLGPSWARIGTICDENTIASASSAYESFVEPPLTMQIHAGSFARRHMLHRLNPVAPAMERTPPTPAPTVRVVLAASGSLPSLGTLLNKLEPLELKHLNADADMVPCVGTEDITAFVIDASPSTKKELQDKVNGIRVKLGRRKLNIRVFDFDDSWESLYSDMWLPFLQASGFKRKSGIRVAQPW